MVNALRPIDTGNGGDTDWLIHRGTEIQGMGEIQIGQYNKIQKYREWGRYR